MARSFSVWCVPIAVLAIRLLWCAPASAQSAGPGCDSADASGRLPVTTRVPSRELFWDVEAVVWKMVEDGRNSLRLQADTAGEDPGAASLRNAVRSDTLQAWDVAAALAELISPTHSPVGGGQYARYASLLYREWLLPPEAARRIVRDREIPPFNRRYALMAVRDRLADAEAAVDLVIVACDLAARAGSYARSMGRESASRSPAASLSLRLDREEVLLARDLVASLAASPAWQAALSRIAAILGDSSLVARYLRAEVPVLASPWDAR
jgi:hypothetical protein